MAEIAHLLTFIIFATICVGFAARGSGTPAVLFAIFNVGFNIYPIMIQRYKRHRVLRLLERRNAVASGASAD